LEPNNHSTCYNAKQSYLSLLYMELTEHLKTNLHDIVDGARFAPSLHNTQPWLVKAHEDTLIIKVDERNTLQAGDPTGRETMIGLGIFTEAIIRCAQDKGLILHTVLLHGSTSTVQFAKKVENPATNPNTYATLLKRRVTDRSRYRRHKLPPKAMRLLNSVESVRGVRVWVSQDRPFIDKVAELTGQGNNLAVTSPAFRQELSKYLLLPWSRKSRGMNTGSFDVPFPIAILQPLLVRFGVGLKTGASLEKKNWQSSSAIICITSKGDLRDDWFAAGRTYLRVSIEVERLGLSQATSAAIVEASNFHEDIEALLGTKERLQSVIRIGIGKQKKVRSPRVATEELLFTSN
jgi:hypothetical protein